VDSVTGVGDDEGLGGRRETHQAPRNARHFLFSFRRMLFRRKPTSPSLPIPIALLLYSGDELFWLDSWTQPAELSAFFSSSLCFLVEFDYPLTRAMRLFLYPQARQPFRPAAFLCLRFPCVNIPCVLRISKTQ
jgi:hypothetical protein